MCQADRKGPWTSLNLLHGFSSNFGCCFPWAICPDVFWIFEKKVCFYLLRIFFVFVNIGPCGSKNFKTLLFLQTAAKCFQTCPIFFSQWPSQNYVWDFCHMLLLNTNRKSYMGSPIPWILPSYLTLNDFERSKLRRRKWPKIDTCIVRYSMWE